MANVRIAVSGCAGKMGRAVLRETARNPRTDIAAGVERADNPSIGSDLGALFGAPPIGIVVGADLLQALAGADALIVFSTPSAAIEHVRFAAESGVALVVGTTGFSTDQEEAIATAARSIPIVKTSNFSLGVALLSSLVEEAARRLSDDFDIEIFEAHHRDKIDAPSGTALTLAEAAARGRDIPLKERAVRIRDGVVGPRRAGDIGFSVRRGGGLIGDHEVAFVSGEEMITLAHRALDRSLFAKGAIAAAIWAPGRKPGLYGMRDVLGLN